MYSSALSTSPGTASNIFLKSILLLISLFELSDVLVLRFHRIKAAQHINSISSSEIYPFSLNKSLISFACFAFGILFSSSIFLKRLS